MGLRTLVGVVAVVGLLATAAHADPDPPPEPSRDDALVTTKPNFGDESSPIRPGASMRHPVGDTADYCTLNFVFYDPKELNPPVYIGTAGHCTSKTGERIRLSSGQTVGTVVYDSDKAGSDVDFSLIRIDAAMVSKTNPKVLGWGGPRGVASRSGLKTGDQVDMHGYGMVLGGQESTRSRWGILTGWTSKEYTADIPAVNGDSGAPLLHHRSGRALGIISRYGVFSIPPSTDAGPLMSWIFAAIDEAGFSNVVLATAN